MRETAPPAPIENITAVAVHPLRPAARPQRLLSRAETRVLAFSAAGYTKEETAAFLQSGDETIKSQRASIMRKFGARNMTHAVALAFARQHLTAEILARVEDYVQARESNLAKSS